MWRDLETHQSGPGDPGSISPSYKELYLLGCCSTVAATAIFRIWGREVCDHSGAAAVLHLAVLSILKNEWWSKPTRNSSERHSVGLLLGQILSNWALSCLGRSWPWSQLPGQRGACLPIRAPCCSPLPPPSSSTCLQLSDVFGHLRLISWGYLPGTDGDFHVLWWHIRNSEIHRLIVEIPVFILVPSEIRYLQIWVV